MGSKYDWKPKDGPAPGEYEPADNMTKPKIQTAHIKEETHPFRRPADHVPEPGTYSGHIKPLGADLKTTATMGSKYDWKPKDGPAPGEYETGADAIKPTIPAAHIKEETHPFRRPAENMPDPGQYDGHLKPLGSELKTVVKMDNLRKHNFYPTSGPVVG